jgi:hypothetical protein
VRSALALAYPFPLTVLIVAYTALDSVLKVQQKAETRSGHGMLVMFNVTDP